MDVIYEGMSEAQPFDCEILQFNIDQCTISSTAFVPNLSHRPFRPSHPIHRTNDPTLKLYTLPSRIAYAGWTEDTISSYKGPTPSIVSGLASHTRKTLDSTYTVAESGTAGPTGGDSRNRTP